MVPLWLAFTVGLGIGLVVGASVMFAVVVLGDER